MKIGIDLRALQTGHKFRGIGEVAKQITSRIITLGIEDNEFIFYEYEDADDPKTMLSLPNGIKFRVITQGRVIEKTQRSRGQKLRAAFNQLYGTPVKGSGESDVFLQYDYAFGVPKDAKTILVMHDLIPLIFKTQYFESAWIPFRNRALRTTLRTMFANYRYMRLLRRGLANAHSVVCVSASTKKDVIKFFHVPEHKLQVVHLGVDVKPAKTADAVKPSQLPAKPYLLFVGAGDARRRIDDLVVVFNNLKADGNDIQLALVGENFASAEKIPNLMTRDAVLSSSYIKDILTLGYVDDSTKQALYKGAIAFVYPTLYEGFGIPVLEAMLLRCPIVTYRNSSIPEVGGTYAHYAYDWQGMKEITEMLLSQDAEQRGRELNASYAHAVAFTWDASAEKIFDIIIQRR